MMKKILTLMVSVATAASVLAAPASHTTVSKAAISAHAYPGKEREKQIERINHDYDKRIEAIRRDRHLKGYEKDRQIRMLEEGRVRAIREVNQRYHYYDNDRRDDRRDWKH